MTAFFSYSTIGSELFIIILIPMTCIMPHRRFGLFLVTLGVLADIIIASVGSYVSSNALKSVEYSTDVFASYESNFIRDQYFGFPTLLLYLIIRIGISFKETAVRDLWNKGSTLTRACYVIQLLFTGAIGFLLLIHMVVFVAWLVKTLFSLLRTVKQSIP